MKQMNTISIENKPSINVHCKNYILQIKSEILFKKENKITVHHIQHI